MIERVVVVVPARNEEGLLPRCLEALGAAVRAVPAARVVVVLDRCDDGSAQVATGYGVETVVTTCGSVGGARAAGIRHALADAPTEELPHTWLACTDADSVVPAHWLTGQLTFAEAGVDCVIGTVEPLGLERSRERAWHAAHILSEGHRHVHGANLGVRASSYVDVGGFGEEPLHEDANLITRLRSAGHHCHATDAMRVGTSARITSRVDGGFASYLAATSDAG